MTHKLHINLNIIAIIFFTLLKRHGSTNERLSQGWRGRADGEGG